MDYTQQLAFEIQRLGRRLDAVETRTLVVPIVDTDPGTEDPITLWGFADGRLRLRLPNGSVVTYSPDNVLLDYIDAGPPILSADPAASDTQKWWVNSGTGQLRVRTSSAVRSYAPTASGSSSTTGGRPPGGVSTTVLKPVPPPPTKSYDRTKTCEWIACYDGGNDRRATSGNMYYGRVSSIWGLQKIMMGFENWRSDLTGADIQYAELIINSLHTWPHAGTRVFFGTHTASSAPGSYSRKSKENFSKVLPDGGSVRVPVNPKFIEQLRDNTIDGFTVEQPDSSKTRYGYMDDNVKLRVKYVK